MVSCWWQSACKTPVTAVKRLCAPADAAVKAVVFIQPCGDLYSRAGVRATTGSIAEVPACNVDSSQAAIQAFRQRMASGGQHQPLALCSLGCPAEGTARVWVGTEDSGLTSRHPRFTGRDGHHPHGRWRAFVERRRRQRHPALRGPPPEPVGRSTGRSQELGEGDRRNTGNLNAIHLY